MDKDSLKGCPDVGATCSLKAIPLVKNKIRVNKKVIKNSWHLKSKYFVTNIMAFKNNCHDRGLKKDTRVTHTHPADTSATPTAIVRQWKKVLLLSGRV
jgi:hypothetical protein